MKRKKWIIICFVALIAYAILTGGLVVSNRHNFGGQRDIPLASGLESDIWLAPQTTRWSIPFLFHYYGESSPYSLRVQIWDTSKSYVAIEISEIELQYSDGEIIHITDKWFRKLRPYPQHNSSGGRHIKTEMLQLGDTVDSLVTRHKDVKITIKGHLLDSDGNKLEFLASENFEAENRFLIFTGWQLGMSRLLM